MNPSPIPAPNPALTPTPTPAFRNTLYFGDNLDILQKHLTDALVDLVYLDPPFNSNRDYNVLFKEQTGHESPAQIKAFGDTWNWAGAASVWDEFTEICPNEKVIDLMRGFVHAIGKNDVTAYLVMMAPRLFHLHRVLKPTGSLYLHCDPTASHYLKLLLDALFGVKNYRNEIIWERTGAHSDAKRWGRVTDTILFYTKSSDFVFNTQRTQYSEEHLTKRFTYTDDNGRKFWPNTCLAPGGRGPLYEWNGHTRNWRFTKENMAALDAKGDIYYSEKGVPYRKNYLDELQGMAVQNLWADIKMTKSGAEKLGYPTQKPVALLERIIAASSNEGDVVLDPFCGCGTTITAAQKMNRHWIGIDVTPIATSLIQARLEKSFGARDIRLLSKNDPAQRLAFVVEGLPTDLAGAKLLYDKDVLHKDFEMWAVGLVPALPNDKKGGDGGIDGITYTHDNPDKPGKVVVQVKGGHVNPGFISQLHGTMTRENAVMGFFICLEKPTKGMIADAAKFGFYTPRVGKKVPVIQIRTIEELLNGDAFDGPLTGGIGAYKDAVKVQVTGQKALFDGSDASPH